MTKPKKRKNTKNLTDDDFKNIQNPTRDIMNILDEVEYDNNIEIILSSLHGSRMYDFNNDFADYNILFIYKRNIEEYLTINEIPSKIEYKEFEYKLKGIDIKKAMELHRESDLLMYEMVNSHTKYIDKYDFNALIPFDTTELMNQCTNLASSNFQISRKDIPYHLKLDDVRNYIYAIIYVLLWDELYNGNNPSFQLAELMKPLDDYLQEYIQAFVRSYQSEYLRLGYVELSNINSWLYNHIKIMKNTRLPQPRNIGYEYHNGKFREIINTQNRQNRKNSQNYQKS